MELLKSLSDEGKLVDGVKQIAEKQKARRSSKSIKKEKSWTNYNHKKVYNKFY